MKINKGNFSLIVLFMFSTSVFADQETDDFVTSMFLTDSYHLTCVRVLITLNDLPNYSIDLEKVTQVALFDDGPYRVKGAIYYFKTSILKQLNSKEGNWEDIEVGCAFNIVQEQIVAMIDVTDQELLLIAGEL